MTTFMFFPDYQHCVGMDGDRLNPYAVALLEAARKGDHRVMRELLRSGANPDASDYDGWRPLMFAAEGGHTQCVRLLLEYGADADYDGAYNEGSVLALAVDNGHEGCVLLLLQAGAEMDEAFTMAIENGFVQCTKFLLKEGVVREELVGIRNQVTSNEMWKVVAAAGADVFYRVRYNSVPSLRSTCHKVIRRRLMIVGDSQNLFHKVPLLGLPNLVQEYLLYNVKLD